VKFILKSILFFSLPFLSYKNAISQTTNTEKVIDGGKLILDIFKTVKDNKTEHKANPTAPTKKGESTVKERDICFYNPTLARVNVEVTTKGNLTTNICNSTIPANDSICCFAIKDGLYHIKITEAGNAANVIKENDVLINDANIETLKLIVK
jgi:hypothetical protein